MYHMYATKSSNELRFHFPHSTCSHCLLPSVAAVDSHIIPLNVVKLGFVLKGHEFKVDQDPRFQGESVEDRELARYDELKNTLAVLIQHVSLGEYHASSLNTTVPSYVGVCWLSC